MRGFLLSPTGLLLQLVILAVAVASARRRALIPLAGWLAAWAAVTCGTMLVNGGVGHTRGFWSVVGQLAVLGIAMALPLGAAAIMGRFIARRAGSRALIAGTMFVSGGLVAYATPLTALWLTAVILNEGV